jgi:hypothetical protein
MTKEQSQSNDTPLYPAYARDIRNLLLKYLEKQTTSFTEFKEIWKSMNFALIHEGKPDDVSSVLYVQELFSTCLGVYPL